MWEESHLKGQSVAFQPQPQQGRTGNAGVFIMCDVLFMYGPAAVFCMNTNDICVFDIAKFHFAFIEW